MSRSKKTASSGKSKPINDVAKPGTTAPPETSKPIITHRPMIKDPMVVEDENKPEATAEKPLSKRASEAKIEPPEKPEPEPGDPKPGNETAADEPPADTPDATKPDAAAPDEKAGEATDNKAGGVDKKPASTTGPEAETAEEAARDAKLQQLIDSKKYFLPINSIEQRKSRRFVVLGMFLAVLLALAWVNIALDAGLIELEGIKPVTHFFSN